MPMELGVPAPLWQAFQERTSQFLQHPALSMSRREMTFRDVWNCAADIADSLAKVGVQEKSMVALALSNCMAFVPALLALCKLSARVALVSPHSGANELQDIAGKVGLHSFLTAASLAERLKERTPVAKTHVIPGPEGGEALVLLIPMRSAFQEERAHSSEGPGDIPLANAALIKFTSGSTGEPKGIALSVDNILAEAQNVVATLSLTSADRILAPVPMVHSYGFDLGVLGMLFSGATLILHESFIPRRVCADFSKEDVTAFLGVPSMYRALLESHLSSPPRLAYVRYLLSCTAPLNPDLITAFYQKFGAPICQHYGSSEVGAITTHIPSEVLDRPTSVGVPMKNVEVKIVNQHGDPLAANMEGQVVVRSAGVAQGYVMGRPHGDNPFREGTFWTGDLGVIDDDGFVHLRGRIDEVINVGGLKVWANEVTRVLESFPAVREAAVFGARDPLGGQTVSAIVTLKAPATENEILAFCRKWLADFKIPRRIDIRNAMPRGPSGKIKFPMN